MAVQPVYYELYDYDKHVGRYSSSELMLMLDIHHRQLITYYLNSGHRYMGRYLIEKVEEPIRESWAAEWDMIRMEILWLIRNRKNWRTKLTFEKGNRG